MIKSIEVNTVIKCRNKKKTFWAQQIDFLLKAVSENTNLVLFVVEIIMKLYVSQLWDT